MITIYHNPRCSKSREALTLVQQFADTHKMTLGIIDYQKTPLTLEQLSLLQRQLGDTVRAMVRDNEEEFAVLHLDNADDAMLLQALVDHPKLLQRPIVVSHDRAIIARPPARLLGLLEHIKPE